MNAHLLIADDLTGGSDAGVQFAIQGLNTWVGLSEPWVEQTPPSGTDVRVINTNTRNVSKETAHAVLAELSRSLSQSLSHHLSWVRTHDTLVCKKIDSTLRGNVGVEVQALMDGFDFAMAFVCPSYPDQGRTVTNGHLFVQGQPVHTTAFAYDPLCPARHSSVLERIAEQVDRTVGLVPLRTVRDSPKAFMKAIEALHAQGCSIVVLDAHTDEDLLRIVHGGFACEHQPLFVGSAGLTQALARTLGAQSQKLKVHGEKFQEQESQEQKSQEPKSYRQMPFEFAATHPVLFVCGSANRTTQEQVNLLAQKLSLFRLSDSLDVSACIAGLTQGLKQGDCIVAAPVPDVVPDPLVAARIPAALGRVVHAVLQSNPHMTLALTGGETALAVLQTLGAQGLTLQSELLPGIVLAQLTGSPWHGLSLVTKAGGFGTSDTLALCNALFSTPSQREIL